MEVDSSNIVGVFKHFNHIVKEYSHRSDETSTGLLENLKMVCSDKSWETLDPGNRDITDFFVNLYELLRTHDEKSDVTWASVSVLEEAIKQSQLKESLLHTFKFVPELTKLLNESATWEKKLRILELLKELTYGIKITWQEAYLPFLISSLVKWISGDDPSLIILSLEILANLCYKNTPAVYTLMKSVDTKQFLKIIFRLLKQKIDSQCKIQVCKMLIILEDISGGVPDTEMEMFVRSISPSLADAIQASNPALMKHIINFFKEMLHTDKITKAISQYPSYSEDIEKLLETVNEPDRLNPDCLTALFDYLCCVIDLRVFGLEALYLQMLRLASSWIDVEPVSSQALTLISKITGDLFMKKDVIPSQEQAIIDDVSEFLKEKLPDIIKQLDNGGSNDSGFQRIITLRRLTSLMLLLTQLVRIGAFSSSITDVVDQCVLRKLFDPLLQPNYKDSDLFQKPLYSFYVEALCFIASLASKETTWLLLYNDLLQEIQIHMILSIALYAGSESIKKKVLILTGTSGFSSDCLALLASQMTMLNKLVSVSPINHESLNTTSSSSGSVSPLDVMPLLTITQQGHLNSVLEKCELAARKNKNSLTTSIMELYQYRISVMEQEARQAQASQVAADSRVAHLQASLSQTNAEVGRLHRLLYSTTQNLEDTTKECNNLGEKLNTLRVEAEEVQNNYSQCLQNLRSKTVIIANFNKEVDELKCVMSKLENDIKSLHGDIINKDNIIDSLNKDIAEQSSVIKKMEAYSCEKENQISQLNEELNELNRISVKKENQISVLNKELSELNKISSKKDTQISELNKELSELNRISSKKDNQILEINKKLSELNKISCEKDDQISDLNKELIELKRMREMISELTLGKRKM